MKLAIKTCTLDMPYSDMLDFCVEQGVDAALEKGADVVVLCSSDDEYATLAPEAYKYLNGRAEFVVAGNPACTDELKAQGINDFVHVRCNVLEVLQDFNNRLLK